MFAKSLGLSVMKTQSERGRIASKAMKHTLVIGVSPKMQRSHSQVYDLKTLAPGDRRLLPQHCL